MSVARDMTLDELHELARLMLADLDARQPGRRAGFPASLTIAQAYSLQEAVSDLRAERGERVIGYKIGCTSRAIQDQLGIGQPIFGRVFDTGSLHSGARLNCSRYANLAVEGELAIRLAEDLSNPTLSDEHWVEAVESVFPVIELHDYVLRCDPPCAAELIARNGMHAGFVAGEERSEAFSPLRAFQGLCVRINESVAASTTEPWAMGSPGAAIRWLARALGEFGLHLLRGQVILTGSVMRLLPVGPGSDITVESAPSGQRVWATCD
jgi:2-keto-4-pentenoate hydratase